MQKNLGIKDRDMIRLSGQKVAAELLEILNEGEIYKVHSQFESGCNLVLPFSLCFIGNKNNALIPYGILLSKEELPVFLRQAASSGCFQWDGKEKVLYSNSLCLCLKDSRIYSSFLQKKAYSMEYKGLTIFEKLIDWNLPTGFGESIGSFMMTREKELKELYQAFSKPREEAVQTIKKWIGRGQGLTPSGDDFLMGILYINRIYPILEMPFLESLQELADQRYTTDISEHYYICALKGYFNYVLVELSDALALKDSFLIEKCMGSIKKIGSTSGCDMILGMAAGIRFIKSKNGLEVINEKN